MPSWLRVEPEVAAALAAQVPVVALESTVITHGLPRPDNLGLAREMEALVRARSAIPATVAVLEGRVCLGLTSEELERLALASSPHKLNRRDLSVAAAQALTGGTTVSATMYVAHAAGVPLLATGGIGGVHRGDAGDVSADLPELARTPVGVVCSGAKAILDLPRTLEWLETAGVPVVGYGTDTFPAFFARDSGLPVSARADIPPQVAEILAKHRSLGMESGVLICVPCPEDAAISPMAVESALTQALAAAERSNLRGKALTPFLLERLVELSGGETLRANLALLKNNASVAAEIAGALCA